MDNQTTSQERLESLSSSESPRHGAERQKPQEARDISKKAKEALKTEAEGIEGAEGIEFSEGKISEAAGEDKAHAPLAGAGKYSADEIEAIRAKLLAALPPQAVMIRQIRKKLYKEERVLTKRMKKFQKKSHKHAYALTIIIAKLRKIREYLAMLAYATYEVIKNLWLKIVHGV